MSTQLWNNQRNYREGERAKHRGIVYEAKMDLTRNIEPGPGTKAFWRKATLITPMKSDNDQPKAPRKNQQRASGPDLTKQYFTRDLKPR